MFGNEKLLWEKLDKIDDKLSGPTGLSVINARLDGLEKRLDKIENCLDSVEEKLENKLATSTFHWFFGILVTALIATFSTIGWWMPLLHN